MVIEKLLKWGSVTFWLLFVCYLPGLTIAEPAMPVQTGWLEQVKISPPGLLLHAKLDTGADNCSLHAENIVSFKRDGQKWVRFEVSSRYGEQATIKRRVIKNAKIKSKGRVAQRRPVVRLGICLARHYEFIECNLVDRSDFTQPILIGRTFLAGLALINSSETYITTPDC